MDDIRLNTCSTPLGLLFIDQQSLCDTPPSGVPLSACISVNNYLLSLLLLCYTTWIVDYGCNLFPIWSSCAPAILIPLPPKECKNGRGHEMLLWHLLLDYKCIHRRIE